MLAESGTNSLASLQGGCLITSKPKLAQKAQRLNRSEESFPNASTLISCVVAQSGWFPTGPAGRSTLGVGEKLKLK